MPRPSFITLFLAIAVAQVLVATSPAANALQGVGVPPHVVNRAEHVDMNRRMVKQRRAATDDTPINPAAGDDTGASPSTSAPATTSTPAAAGGNGNEAASHTTTTAQSTSSNIGLIGTISQLLNGSSTSSTTSITSTIPTSSTPPASNTAQTTTPSNTPSAVHSTTKSGTVVYVTASVTNSAVASDAASDPNNSNLPHGVIIGLIVAGSCVVGIAAIWTIIRKWKFSPSRHFEDRLEPINWEPTQASGVDHDPTMAALGRSTSRNGGRPDSFHSGDGHGSVRNMSTAHNDSVTMAPDFPPPHDFTAGASNGLSAAGYVDMHRGPSPAPTYGGAYGAGAGAYGGQHETPNPYDAYDYNAGYGQQQRRY